MFSLNKQISLMAIKSAQARTASVLSTCKSTQNYTNTSSSLY